MIPALLIFSWLMLAVVIFATAREARKRRETRRRLAELEKELAAEKECSFTRSCEMAEKSLRLLELKESLEAEQAHSEELLHNILPDRVIAELRDTGQSRPERFDAVTVFFSDIVGFTARSAELAPETVIRELSELFSSFDRIFTANGCARIKTIGDAYLAVSGMPDPDPNHAENVLRAALEARNYLAERNRSDGLRWEMRFGIHSGPVVGGIVGTERYLYDIFGDTVNTAARMEQLSEPMRINVSETTRILVPSRGTFTPRPPCEVKGKGMMKMYFLE